jgi:hypothetical protein
MARHFFAPGSRVILTNSKTAESFSYFDSDATAKKQRSNGRRKEEIEDLFFASSFVSLRL